MKMEMFHALFGVICLLVGKALAAICDIAPSAPAPLTWSPTPTPVNHKPRFRPLGEYPTQPKICIDDRYPKLIATNGDYTPADIPIELISQSANGTHVEFKISQEWRLLPLDWFAFVYDFYPSGETVCNAHFNVSGGPFPGTFVALCNSMSGTTEVKILGRHDCFSSVVHSSIEIPDECAAPGMGNIVAYVYKLQCRECDDNPMHTLQHTTEPTSPLTVKPSVCIDTPEPEKTWTNGKYDPADEIIRIISRSTDGSFVDFQVFQEWSLLPLEWIAVDYVSPMGNQCESFFNVPAGKLPLSFTASCGEDSLAEITVFAKDDCFTELSSVIAPPNNCHTPQSDKNILVSTFKVPCADCYGSLSKEKPCLKVPEITENIGTSKYPPADNIIVITNYYEDGLKVDFDVGQWWKLMSLEWIAVLYRDGANGEEVCLYKEAVPSGDTALRIHRALCANNVAEITVFAYDDCFQDLLTSVESIPEVCNHPPQSSGGLLSVQMKLPCTSGCL